MSPAVRVACADDFTAIREILLAAFPGAAEADLVEALRNDGDVLLELVHDDESGTPNGYSLLSRMALFAAGEMWPGAGLAPVAVVPTSQRGGVGEALIRQSLVEAAALGVAMVFVLGSPEYYGRFGFDAAAAAPFPTAFSGPNFQAILLDPRFSLPKSGLADYAPAFAALGG